MRRSAKRGQISRVCFVALLLAMTGAERQLARNTVLGIKS